MSARDDFDEGLDGDDALAAEYVVGALPLAEREALARRMVEDREFAALVDGWEARLAPLGAAYEEVTPPPAVKAALDRRLFASGADVARAGKTVGIWQSLVFWRGLSAAALAALVLLAGRPLLEPVAPDAARLVASLDAQDSDVRYLALYDGAREVSLSHVSGERAQARDFELWMIEGEQAPVSMGVLPGGATIRITLSPEAREKLEAGAVLAISLEPTGGSPTGQPTGPVVAAGSLRDI